MLWLILVVLSIVVLGASTFFVTHQISIISIDTDEGVLEPLGVGEILLEVRY